jgi:aminoglycoside phosphotransferase family enzyme
MSPSPVVEPSPPSVSLATKVAFLSRPDVYPQRPARVDSIETHMSWLFLTDSRVYKLKKPVRYDYLDFSTVEARWADGVAEVHLNRRLAPDVYLGVIPLGLGVDGLRLDGQGVPVDWLVEMRRLPADHMLDSALRAGTADAADIGRVASRLARFYGSAPRAPIAAADYRLRLRRDLCDDRRWLRRPAFGLDPGLASGPASVLLDVLQDHAELIGSRADRLVEGHGDLRPEHVCLGDGEPVVIDCLEFRREFRIIDPVDELAFLGLECERLGADWVGPELLRCYWQLVGDEPAQPVIEFYAARRAVLRAKLAVWHLRDQDVRSTAPWPDVATAYLQLAAAHCHRLTVALPFHAGLTTSGVVQQA